MPPVIASSAGRSPERFEAADRGDATWVTFFSGSRTPTEDLCAGMMEIPPGGGVLKPHRHAEAEIYFFHSGAGVVTVDGVETAVEPGMSIFIPGDAEHSVRNDGAAPLRIFYVFARTDFTDIVYRFSEAAR